MRTLPSRLASWIVLVLTLGASAGALLIARSRQLDLATTVAIVGLPLAFGGVVLAWMQVRLGQQTASTTGQLSLAQVADQLAIAV